MAEDNAVNCRLTARLLEKRGHTVVLARNGWEAREALEKQSFDEILMDGQMPAMDKRRSFADHRVDGPRHASRRQGALPAKRHGRLRQTSQPEDLFREIDRLRLDIAQVLSPNAA